MFQDGDFDHQVNVRLVEPQPNYHFVLRPVTAINQVARLRPFTNGCRASIADGWAIRLIILVDIGKNN